MTRYQAALNIQQGAVNPRAIARALVSAIDSACGEGKGHPGANEDVTVRLIIHQLTHVLYRVDLYDLPIDRNEHGKPAGFGMYCDDIRVCEAKVEGTL